MMGLTAGGVVMAGLVVSVVFTSVVATGMALRSNFSPPIRSKLALRGGGPKAVEATVLAAPRYVSETETTNLSATRI